MLSEKPWKLEQVLLLLAGIFVSFGLVAMVGAVVLHSGGNVNVDQGSLLFVLLTTLSIHGSILAATCLTLWWYRINWREAFGFSAASAGRAMLFGLASAVILLPVGQVLINLSASVISHLPAPIVTRLHMTDEQPAIVILQQAESRNAAIYFAFFTVLIAPFAEEVVFRGILYPVVKQLGYPRLACWGTSLLFAAIHQNWIKFLPLLVLGLVFVWLYERTNNLLASISAHAAFNGINLGLYYLQQHLSQPRP